MKYTVNIESLHQNFPSNCEVPPLLLDFGRWLKSKRAGSVGYFYLQSERFDDYWIEHGADLHQNFAFFIRDPTGGRVGFWIYDGLTTASPPVVMVGSEGELSILSDTLEEFLKRLAEGKTRTPDLDSRDQGGKEEAALRRWLDPRTVKTPTQCHRAHPDLEQWMERWGKQQRDWINKDSLHLQIADKLRKFVKPNAQPWETADFGVLLVGTQFRMWHASFGPTPMPQNELSDLECLFRSVREQRAKKIPERGLWFSSWVKVGSEGGAVLCCNFMDQPEILGQRPTILLSDYKRDLSASPRSEHWMPKWLKEPE
jgi:hypothetical protein